MLTSKFKPPEDVFGDLFEALHKSGIYKDGKVISDAEPKQFVIEILTAYEKEKKKNSFDLKAFFEEHFILPSISDSQFKTDLTKTASEHIKSLWPVLKRNTSEQTEGSSLIQLPYPYIVPGGRFNEIYYWDSYFTMLGLFLQNEWEVIEQMIKNFAWLIDQIGFIPNGNRTYFLGRSQPPFFSLMIELLASEKGDDIFITYKDQLQKEYDFWMMGSESVSENDGPKNHVVKIGSHIVNRYFDKFQSARGEMYQDDLELLERSGRKEKDLFVNVRAACESGWDFSSRWFSDFNSLENIRCSDIVPLDLNCLLYHLENSLAKANLIQGNTKIANEFIEKGKARKKFIQTYLWKEEKGAFFDYLIKEKKQSTSINLSASFPLFFELCTQEQADSTASFLKQHLERPGGFVTTPIHSGQQWDAPNGWAPLQWITIKGLLNYGHVDYANEMAQRWIALNESVYKESGKFVEKYNVEDLSLSAAGGEYPVQDGFGWSNGVYLALKHLSSHKD